jgi:hypothetical protein
VTLRATLALKKQHFSQDDAEAKDCHTHHINYENEGCQATTAEEVDVLKE